jgi:hypothetical protein
MHENLKSVSKLLKSFRNNGICRFSSMKVPPLFQYFAPVSTAASYVRHGLVLHKLMGERTVACKEGKGEDIQVRSHLEAVDLR